MCWLVKILNPLRDFSTLFTRTCCRRGRREKQGDEKDERRTAEQVLLEQVMGFNFEKRELWCFPSQFYSQVPGLKPGPEGKHSLGLAKATVEFYTDTLAMWNPVPHQINKSQSHWPSQDIKFPALRQEGWCWAVKVTFLFEEMNKPNRCTTSPYLDLQCNSQHISRAAQHHHRLLQMKVAYSTRIAWF